MATTRKKMTKKNTGEVGGFTIIEVVLVLAIAGLIFLMVFIALPNLQRSQRDTQRRSDLGKMSSAISQYQTNNNGRLPGSTEGDGLAPEEDADVKKISDYVICSKTTPNPAACFVLNYMNSVNAEYNEWVDPDGTSYGLVISDYSDDFRLRTDEETGSEFTHYVHMVKKARCSRDPDMPEGTLEKSNNARDYAIVYKLEGNGTYCADNNS